MIDAPLLSFALDDASKLENLERHLRRERQRESARACALARRWNQLSGSAPLDADERTKWRSALDRVQWRRIAAQARAEMLASLLLHFDIAQQVARELRVRR